MSLLFIDPNEGEGKSKIKSNPSNKQTSGYAYDQVVRKSKSKSNPSNEQISACFKGQMICINQKQID